MLCLTLQRREEIRIGEDIFIVVERYTRAGVRLHITAPKSLKIDHLIDGKPRQRPAALPPPPFFPKQVTLGGGIARPGCEEI